MNKSELISKIAEETKLTKKDTELFLNTFVDVVEETVVNGERVQIVGFLTFGSKQVAERSGECKIVGREGKWTKPAHKAPTVKIGEKFKQRVANK